jgi:uncharacterized protein YndB with AHSA1/START domain
MNEVLQKSKLAPELVIEREIAYPPEQVFKAWTDQDALKTWMGPGKVSCAGAIMDARVGGVYVFPMRRPDGTGSTARGVIKEIVPNRKLRLTWSWDDKDGEPGDVSEVTLEFHPIATGTRLVLKHAGLTDPQLRERHAHGWNGCNDALEMYLAGKFLPCE